MRSLTLRMRKAGTRNTHSACGRPLSARGTLTPHATRNTPSACGNARAGEKCTSRLPYCSVGSSSVSAREDATEEDTRRAGYKDSRSVTICVMGCLLHVCTETRV